MVSQHWTLKGGINNFYYFSYFLFKILLCLLSEKLKRTREKRKKKEKTRKTKGNMKQEGRKKLNLKKGEICFIFVPACVAWWVAVLTPCRGYPGSCSGLMALLQNIRWNICR